MQYKAISEKDLPLIAKDLLETFSDKKVILFYGEMGAGKTTLIKVLCEELGVDEPTNSPTFSIVNEYASRDDKPVYHFDFYRIEKEEEVLDMGYEDYLYSDNFCFIEWPQKIPNLLPEDALKVTISEGEDNIRLISVAQ